MVVFIGRRQYFDYEVKYCNTTRGKIILVLVEFPIEHPIILGYTNFLQNSHDFGGTWELFM